MNDDTIVAHIPLAKKAAWRACNGNPAQYPDVYSDALYGLVDAARRYNPNRGATFGQFARHRINGAILDGHRTRRRRWLSLDTDLGDGTTLLDLIPAQTDEIDALEDHLDDQTALEAAYATIDDSPYSQLIRDRLTGRSLADVGRAHGVTESRVCQIWREWALAQAVA